MEDGQTALHLAAARGSVEIIRILCVKSDQNKEIARKSGLWTPVSPGPNQIRDDEHSHIRDNQGVDDSVSLVNVKFGDEIDLAPAGNYLDDQPETVDILDPDVVSWGTFMSPLHVGILHGHVDAVRELVSLGADVTKPIKKYRDHNPFQISPPSLRTPCGAVLPLVLALLLKKSLAHEMSRTLLQLGASPAEADLNRCTPLHYIAAMKDTVPLSVYLENNRDQTMRAINYLAIDDRLSQITYSALTTAIATGNPEGALQFLGAGAKPVVEFDAVIATLDSVFPDRQSRFANSTRKCDNAWEFQSAPQPIVVAVQNEWPVVALHLLSQGADPNAHRHRVMDNGVSILDIVRQKMKDMREFLSNSCNSAKEIRSPTVLLDCDMAYLIGLEEGSYRF